MNTLLRTFTVLAGGSALAAGLFLSAGRAAGDATPAHLSWAHDLASSITPANNSYGSPAQIQWAGVDGPVSTNNSVCGTFVTTRAAVRHWLKEGTPGRIITFTSAAGTMGLPNMVSYSTAKAGIIGFTRACANSLVSYGITANAISPSR